MKTVPVAFAFDNNLILPASVCISSLMMNAAQGTFYDIFILYHGKSGLDRKDLDRLPLHYPGCRLNYCPVDGSFEQAFETRGITVATYYRLLLPELVTGYDKIIYSDVDMIFRMDLSEVYDTDVSGKYLAATHDAGINLSPEGRKYIASMQGALAPGEYFQGGFLLMNLRKMREDGMTGKFRALVGREFRYQDQDILNLSCRGGIRYLHPKYDMTDYSFYYAVHHTQEFQALCGTEDTAEAMDTGNLHFNGHKPWKKYSVNFDIWWEYYRKSPVFDRQFYFDFFYSRLNEFDRLSLWKRIKILVRYFVYGRFR